MNKMDARMARLEREGDLMVELARMPCEQLRTKIADLLKNIENLNSSMADLNYTDLANKLEEYRGEMGLFMRECELRAMG
ncbi:MAG: hypothetical protein COA60_005525 [Robiginitomaculum sp.]|nr:hypothetical protein [Robiginitomaculum sp.]